MTTEWVRVILAAIRDALPPRGVVIIAEPMAGAPGAEPMGEAYFGFYLLAMGGGRPQDAKRDRGPSGRSWIPPGSATPKRRVRFSSAPSLASGVKIT